MKTNQELDDLILQNKLILALYRHLNIQFDIYAYTLNKVV